MSVFYPEVNRSLQEVTFPNIWVRLGCNIGHNNGQNQSLTKRFNCSGSLVLRKPFLDQ